MTDVLILYKDKQSRSGSLADSRFWVHIKVSLIVCFSIIAYLLSFIVSKGQNFYYRQLE